MLRKLILFALFALPVTAQRDPEYDFSVVEQVRIDLRDLGYAPLDVIPPEESAIRALAVAADGTLYGATSGKRSHLFRLNPAHGYVEPLGALEGVSAVCRSLVIAGNGNVYIGTTPGGRLLRYTPGREPTTARIGTPLKTEDLGVAVSGENIHALAIDRVRDRIYGLTSPSGYLFSFEIRTSKLTVAGKVAQHNITG